MVQKFSPKFKGEIEGYIKNHLKKNFWRVANIMDYEDVLQEAVITFIEVVKRYESVVSNPAWFMSLFKKAWHDRFYDLAQSASKAKKEVVVDWGAIERSLDDEDSKPALPIDSVENYGPLLHRINSASPELKQICTILFTAPAETLAIIQQELRSSGSKLCGLNKVFCTLIGVDPTKTNLRKQLLELLQS